MITAIDVTTIQEYTPKLEYCQAPDQRTTFLVQHPDLEMMEKSENEAQRSELKGSKMTNVSTTGTQKATLLREILKGWKSFVNSAGKQIAFDPNKVDAMLSMIPPQTRDELYGFVTGNTRLLEVLEEEAKEKGLWKDSVTVDGPVEVEEAAIAV